MRPAIALAVACTVLGCGSGTPAPPPPKSPPRVFLTAPESNVAGTQLPLSVNVTGCQAVSALSILDEGVLVKAVTYAASPTPVVLSSADLGNRYAARGISADLSLVAKATCDDGRSNTSPPVAVRFFPVELVIDPGTQAAPDSFYAEGGIGGTPVTFVGCVGTPSGNALARVDTNGAVIALNASLPFPCTIGSQITDRNLATGKRWLWERGVGAFAFDGTLSITSVLLGSVAALGVGPDGDAIINDDKARPGALKRIAHAAGAGGANVAWTFDPAGLLMGSPRVETSTGTVALSLFIDDMGSNVGTVAVQRVNYATGAVVSKYDLKLIAYGALNAPVIPPGVFDQSGAVLYFPFQIGEQNGLPTSAVIACGTSSSGCSGATLLWQSAPLTGLVLAALPFSAGSQIAAVASQHLWFLDAATGQVTNHSGQPVSPTGALVAQGIQPGAGSDFYLLNGPWGGFPTELVAVDSPAQGELLRYEIEGGTSPSSALNLAIDDSGAAWVRIGLKLVKLLPLTQYRQVRGATP